MGLFSKHLKESEKETSFVRFWVSEKMKEREKEILQDNEMSIGVLFLGIMNTLGTFCNENVRIKGNSDFKELGLDPADNFLGDATLFEWGCYVLFRLDYWIFLHHQNLREEIVIPIRKGFLDLFHVALKIDNLAQIFDQRYEKYCELVRSKADCKEFYYYVSQLIYRTKDGAMPREYNFDHETINQNAIEMWAINVEMQEWEIAMLPLLIDMVKQYVEKR